MRLIDTHCHIYYDSFNNDLNEVINNAKKIQLKK